MIRLPEGFDFVEHAIEVAPTLTAAEQDALVVGGWTGIFERGPSHFESLANEAADRIVSADNAGKSIEAVELLALIEQGTAGVRLQKAAKLASDPRFEVLDVGLRRYARAYAARSLIRVYALDDRCRAETRDAA